jgi:DNA-binding response OmpR family regulator
MKKTIKILIVEDSKTQAEELKYLLETNNYKVQHANDGEEALAMLKQNVPDIIISDVVMPKIDGYELCKRTKSDEDFKKIPVILITSLSGPEEIFKSLTCGADSFVTKPYSEDFIISKVEDIIRSIESGEDQITESNFEMVYGDQKFVIGSTRLQIIDLLLSTNENAVKKSRELDETNKELVLTQHKLNKLNENLEEEVKARTQRIEHLNAVLHAIRNVNQLLVKEKDHEILIKKACKNFIKTRGFYSAWIVLFDDDGKIIDFAGEGGNIDISKPDEKFLRDYIPYCLKEALKTDDIVLIEDMESDCKGCPWLKLHKEGKSCSMVLNLKYGEKNYGILNVLLPDRHFSDKEEQSLFKEIAEDIAFGLYSMELEEKRKQAEEELAKHREHLEELVKERTKELDEKNKELKRYNRLFEGREFRIKELRDKVKELEKRR